MTRDEKELKPSESVREGKLLLTVEEAADRLSVGRSHLYNLLTRGEIVSIKLGRSRRVPAAELERFVSDRLEMERDEVDFVPVGS